MRFSNKLPNFSSPGSREKETGIHLIYTPVLNIINYLVGVMTPSGSAKKGATTFMDIIDNFRSQLNGIFGVKAFVSSLKFISSIENW